MFWEKDDKYYQTYIYSKKKENLLDRKLNENAMVSNSITESKRNFQTLIKKT